MSVTSVGYGGVNRVTCDSVTASAEAHVLGTSGTVYGVEIDNRKNSDPMYFKMIDASSYTVGTDAPGWVFRVPGGKKIFRSLGSRMTGHAFATGVSFACSDAPGTTAGSSPPNDVRAVLITN